MEYAVKNKQIQDAIDFDRKNRMNFENQKKLSSMMNTAVPEQIGMSILFGYVSSLWEIADDPQVKLKLDLTYATVGNLMNAIGYEFANNLQIPEYSTVNDIMIAEKTIAAYLTFLAANEHGMKITVKEDKNIAATNPDNPASWAGYDITVGTIFHNTDFLKAIRGKTKYRDGRYYVYLDDVCEAYRKLTGHDLRKDGVEDAECCFD